MNNLTSSAVLVLLLLITATGCASAPAADVTEATPAADAAEAAPVSEETAEEQDPASAPESVPAPAPAPVASTDCATGLIHDDGQPETGYSFVPSAKWGTYVQRIHSSELPSRQLDQVCVCWLRTRRDPQIEFEVVFFADEEGLPVSEPYAAVSSVANNVPKGKENAGRLWSVDTSEVTVPEGMSYVGVRWDPSADSFFFICADHGDGDSIHQVYYQDDRSKGAWQDALVTRDPIFRGHKAIVVRTLAKPASAP